LPDASIELFTECRELRRKLRYLCTQFRHLLRKKFHLVRPLSSKRVPRASFRAAVFGVSNRSGRGIAEKLRIARFLCSGLARQDRDQRRLAPAEALEG
jgi:hypothetical protein